LTALLSWYNQVCRTRPVRHDLERCRSRQGTDTSGMKSTLTKLRERERQARRNLIIDAAIKLFAAKPFKQVGMRDIAAEAGLSPASIYRIFPIVTLSSSKPSAERARP